MEGDEEERQEEQEGLAFSAIENLREFQLIFAHPEALVGNKNVIKLLKTAELKIVSKPSLWMKHISLLTGECYMHVYVVVYLFSLISCISLLFLLFWGWQCKLMLLNVLR